MLIAPHVCAQSYRVVIVPDNIVTENIALDSFIYDATAEYFADGVATILNQTDSINVPPVSQIRTMLKNTPSNMLSAKNLTTRFKNTYNIDYDSLRRIAVQADSKYALLITSSIDAENYILRRTWWDFFNIAGASVIDPAYKISTYAVLVDTEANKQLWADTYYKTISVCENRIITRGPSPQTEQLEKIKDYSRYLCPQIAQKVQLNILPAGSGESKHIYYDMGNIDNVFTKKYRHLYKETRKVVDKDVEATKNYIDEQKTKRKESKTKRAEELKVKATPIYNNDSNINNINSVKKDNQPAVEPKSAVYTKKNEIEGIDLDIRNRKNTLLIETPLDQPSLRDYDK